MGYLADNTNDDEEKKIGIQKESHITFLGKKDRYEMACTASLLFGSACLNPHFKKIFIYF